MNCSSNCSIPARPSSTGTPVNGGASSPPPAPGRPFPIRDTGRSHSSNSAGGRAGSSSCRPGRRAVDGRMLFAESSGAAVRADATALVELRHRPGDGQGGPARRHGNNPVLRAGRRSDMVFPRHPHQGKIERAGSCRGIRPDKWNAVRNA